MKTKPLFIVLSLCLAASTALASFLPLWYDVPKRNNPHDPFTKRPTFTNNPPFIPTPTPVCVGGVDSSLFNFEAGLQGWASTAAGGYTIINSLTNTAVVTCNGSKALCGSVTFTHGGSAQKAVFSDAYSADLGGRKLSA